MGSLLSTRRVTRRQPKAQPEPAEPPAQGPVTFGPKLATMFPFDTNYLNMNQGSFGTIPKDIQAKQREYQALAEARPDPFIRYDYPKLVDESRAAIARLLSAPINSVVFVPNATTACNTVLRNLVWDADGKDVILCFSTIYAGIDKTIQYIVDSQRGLVSSHTIHIPWKIENNEITARFAAAVQHLRDQGKRPRVCVFDVVSSQPGIRFPFERMTQICRELGVMSLIDGAQGVGMVDLDLGALDPDFFVSNCHKWLFAPRGCAVFYVPERNQALIRSTIPTSHGYVRESRQDEDVGEAVAPRPHLPKSTKTEFVNNFEFTGTMDNAPFLCVKDSIAWREKVLGGEERIREYLWKLAKDGGKRVAEICGTWVLENSEGTMTNCGMVNVALPLVFTNGEESTPHANGSPPASSASLPLRDTDWAWKWMEGTLIKEYNTFIVLYLNEGRLWTRLSAQVYLDMEDFEWAGRTLKELCEKVVAEYSKSGPDGKEEA